MGRRHAGFSLVELVATVAVLAIVLALALPSFRALAERHQSLGAFHSLTAALAGARIAAIQRGRPVSVCPSADGRSCRTDGDWSKGWLVYSDPERSPQPASPDAILWVEQRSDEAVLIRASSGRPRVRYQPTGFAGGSNASLRLCTRDGRHLGSIVVNLAGRARSERVRTEPPPPCPYPP